MTGGSPTKFAYHETPVKSFQKHAILSFLPISLLFIFLFSMTAKADYAPVSSTMLNLSSEFGGGWAQDDVVYSISQINGENTMMLAGYTKSSGAGGSDVWLIKVTQHLNVFPGLGSYYMDAVQWRRTYGGAQDDMAKSVIQASDGGYILAGYTRSYGAGGSDMYLIKVGSEGNLSWNVTYGSTQDDVANIVVQANDGGYILAGYTSSSVQSQSAWLVKTDSSGQMRWNQVYPGLDANSIIRTSDGGYALATKYFNAFELVKLDSSGQMQWNQTYAGPNEAEAESVIQTSDGGYAMAGWTSAGAGSYSARVVKTDSSGNVQWDRTYAGLGAYAMAQTNDGGYALTGDRACLILLNSTGYIQWNRNYDALSEDNLHFTRTYSIIQPSPNQFVIAGTQQSYGQILTGLDGILVRITLRIVADTMPPKITILSPENKIYTTRNVPLVFTINKPTVWIAYQIDSGQNVSISGNTTISLLDGWHNMTVYATDPDYNHGASSTVYFSNFAVDTVPINITVNSIQNTTITSKDVPLNFSVGKPVSWIAYCLDGQTNITISQNTTLKGIASGTHTLMVYAQDTIGIIEASSTINFVVADAATPEFPNTLVLSCALAIISAAAIFLKIRRGRRYRQFQNNNSD